MRIALFWMTQKKKNLGKEEIKELLAQKKD